MPVLNDLKPVRRMVPESGVEIEMSPRGSGLNEMLRRLKRLSKSSNS